MWNAIKKFLSTQKMQVPEAPGSWSPVKQKPQVNEIISRSHEKPQIIYKHSFDCGVSSYALEQLDNVFDTLEHAAEMNFIDVINARNVSTYTAKTLDVKHESPQILLLKDGEVVWHTSHADIKSDKLLEVISNH